jgi:hypothetical protein
VGCQADPPRFPVSQPRPSRNFFCGLRVSPDTVGPGRGSELTAGGIKGGLVRPSPRNYGFIRRPRKPLKDSHVSIMKIARPRTGMRRRSDAQAQPSDASISGGLSLALVLAFEHYQDRTATYGYRRRDRAVLLRARAFSFAINRGRFERTPR